MRRCQYALFQPVGLVVLLLFLVPSWLAATDHEMRECLLFELEAAADSVTAAEIRQRCAPESQSMSLGASAVERRIEAERRTMGETFVITPYRPNYLLPFTTNSEGNGQSIPQPEIDEQDIQDEELKFQLSFKLPLWRGVLSENNDLFFAYTQTAWWQAFSGDLSAPFRETNYEPELILRHYGGPEFLGAKISSWDFGINHQSNGRGGSLSRAWNRLVGQVVFDINPDVALGVRAWHRIPEDEAKDDNPRIYRYLGYGEARLAWAPGHHTVTAMIRPGTEELAFELTWSMRLEENVRLYAQYFNGYGENLLDYDKRAERLGIGIAFSDFLQ